MKQTKEELIRNNEILNSKIRRLDTSNLDLNDRLTKQIESKEAAIERHILVMENIVASFLSQPLKTKHDRNSGDYETETFGSPNIRQEDKHRSMSPYN